MAMLNDDKHGEIYIPDQVYNDWFERKFPEDKGAPSSAGYHFYSTFKSCPRKWYLRYIIGWSPERLAAPLMLGIAIHHAFERYWKENADLEATFEGEFDRLGAAAVDLIKWGVDRKRGQLLLSTWKRTREAAERERYSVVAIEETHTVSMGDYGFTVRPDIVLYDRDNDRTVIRDTKTTGYSVDATVDSVKNGDQMTAYIWGWNATHPDQPAEFGLVDVLYNRGSVYRTEQSDPLYVTRYAQQLFALGMYGTILDLSYRVEALDDTPHEMLFGRCADMCSRWGCEYLEICRDRIRPGDRAPRGYVNVPPLEGYNPDLEKLRDQLEVPNV